MKVLAQPGPGVWSHKGKEGEGGGALFPSRWGGVGGARPGALGYSWPPEQLCVPCSNKTPKAPAGRTED